MPTTKRELEHTIFKIGAAWAIRTILQTHLELMKKFPGKHDAYSAVLVETACQVNEAADERAQELWPDYEQPDSEKASQGGMS